MFFLPSASLTARDPIPTDGKTERQKDSIMKILMLDSTILREGKTMGNQIFMLESTKPLHICKILMCSHKKIQFS